jgi:hypothetical protein
VDLIFSSGIKEREEFTVFIILNGGFIMKQAESLEKLEKTLKKKEMEALTAKDKGLNTAYGNLLLEINLIKTKMKKFQMGSRSELA